MHAAKCPLRSRIMAARVGRPRPPAARLTACGRACARARAHAHASALAPACAAGVLERIRLRLRRVGSRLRRGVQGLAAAQPGAGQRVPDAQEVRGAHVHSLVLRLLQLEWARRSAIADDSEIILTAGTFGTRRHAGPP